MELDRVGATLFEVFFPRFCRTVADARFPPDQAELVAGAIGGLATELLVDDPAGWFGERSRDAAVLGAMEATLADLADRLGPDMKTWTWGRLHPIPLQHVLSGPGRPRPAPRPRRRARQGQRRHRLQHGLRPELPGADRARTTA